jgi:hypothetical protein
VSLNLLTKFVILYTVGKENTMPAKPSPVNLKNTRVLLVYAELGRFPIETANVTVLPSGPRTMHLTLHGPKGSIAIEMPCRVACALAAFLRQPVRFRPKRGKKTREEAIIEYEECILSSARRPAILPKKAKP